MRITHPPLLPADLADIAQRHTSPAATTLLREIDRLRRVESLVRRAIMLPSDHPDRRPLQLQILAAMRGVLDPPHDYGHTGRGSKTETRGVIAAARLDERWLGDNALPFAEDWQP